MWDTLSIIMVSTIGACCLFSGGFLLGAMWRASREAENHWILMEGSVEDDK